jgi:hypothetical protein
MKSEVISTIVGVVVCLVIGVGGIFYMFDLVKQDMRQGAQQRMDGRSYGPLDNEMADIAGVRRRPKRKQSVLPQANPVNLKFD